MSENQGPAVAEIGSAIIALARKLISSSPEIPQDVPAINQRPHDRGRSTSSSRVRVASATRWDTAAASACLEVWRSRLELGAPRKFKADEHLSTADSGRAVFIVVSGVVGMFCHMCTGSHLYSLCYPGHLIEVSPRGDGNAAWAAALTEVTAYRLTAEQLRIAGERDAVIRELTEQCARVQTQRLTTALAELMALCPAVRLEHQLRELMCVMSTHVHRPQSSDLAAPLSGEQWAMLLGVSLRQFHRLKRKLEQEGRLVVDDRGRIRLPRAA
jgi:CRP-like cAMP-binding protein